MIKENQDSETGWILVPKGQAILSNEIEAKHFYKTKRDAYENLKASFDLNPFASELLELAKVEGYREIQPYFRSNETIEIINYLQEFYGCRIKALSLKWEK